MKRKTIRLISISLCICMALFCFAACGGSKSDDSGSTGIVGTWESVEAPGCFYNFNEDGSGNFDSEGDILNLTYTVNGNNVEITWEGSSTPQIWEYKIEGDTLSLTNTEYSQTLTYTKK